MCDDIATIACIGDLVNTSASIYLVSTSTTSNRVSSSTTSQVVIGCTTSDIDARGGELADINS